MLYPINEAAPWETTEQQASGVACPRCGLSLERSVSERIVRGEAPEGFGVPALATPVRFESLNKRPHPPCPAISCSIMGIGV